MLSKHCGFSRNAAPTRGAGGAAGTSGMGAARQKTVWWDASACSAWCPAPRLLLQAQAPLGAGAAEEPHSPHLTEK